MSTPVRRAIYGRMAGDTTLRNLLGAPATGRSNAIYSGVAPEGAAFPYVIFNKQAGTPQYSFQQGGTAAYTEDVWLVKGVDHGSSADAAEAIQARLDVLLTDAPLTISGEILMYLRRTSDVDYTETDVGEQYEHHGALWRLVYEP